MESWLYKQGEEKGIERGIERGIEMAIAKGRVQEAREAVVLLYEARFGTMSAPVRGRVEATDDLAVARQWVQLVARSSKEEVDAALSGNGH